MNKGIQTLGNTAGLLIPLWLFGGVFIASLFYPGYSHFDQAMSELGATDSPTQNLSPIINNYPLGLLFLLFGVSVYFGPLTSRLVKVSAGLIALHGLVSILAGYFSCDVGCNPESPSVSQNMHNLAGLIMFLTLATAGFIWVYLGLRLLQSKRFAWFSLVCTLIALLVLPFMAQAVETGTGYGLYQRINYGASVVWVAGLAWVLRPIQH